MAGEVSVHLIDDDAAVLHSVALLLRAHGIPVQPYASGQAFLDGPPVSRGCVLSDVRMPGIDGIELLRALRRRGSQIPFLVMTGHADVAMAVEAMKAGAMDFIEKPFTDEAVLSVVRRGLQASEAQAVQDGQVEEARTRLGTLSAREREILSAVSEGKASKTIAYELGLSVRTVEVHRGNLMAKLNVDNVTSAIALLRRAGEPVSGQPVGTL